MTKAIQTEPSETQNKMTCDNCTKFEKEEWMEQAEAWDIGCCWNRNSEHFCHYLSGDHPFCGEEHVINPVWEQSS